MDNLGIKSVIRRARAGADQRIAQCSKCEWAGNKLVCGQCRPIATLKPASEDTKRPISDTNGSKGVSKAVSKGGPNKTESEYWMHLKAEYPQCRVIFEGLRLRLSTGEIYTPDFIVIHAAGILCVEVKHSGYKFASYGRSKLAYKLAAQEWPFQFRWASKGKDGWTVKDYEKEED